MPKRGSKNKNKRSSNKNKHKNNKQNQYKHDPPPPNPSILQHSIPKTKAMQLKEKGNNEFVNLNFKKAIHFYTKGIELEPNNHTLYSNRSVAYLKLNKYELALKDANKCIELQPDWYKGYVRKCNVFIHQNQIKEATEVYKKGLQLCCNKEPIREVMIPHLENTEQKTESNAQYIQRINNVLKILEDIDSNTDNNSNDIYDMICKEYNNNNAIDRFINDFAEFVEHIDDNNIYMQYKNKCDMKNCKSIAREYRDRQIYDRHSMKHMYKLYKNCISAESIIIQQLLDQIHINKYHLIDMGLRNDINNKDIDEKKDNKNDNNSNIIISNVLNNRNRFNLIRNDLKSNKNNNKTHNKFVTEIRNGHNNNNKYPKYSFGVRFYYHKYYKNNNTTQEILAGTDFMELGNTLI
eukprot:91002_1